MWLVPTDVKGDFSKGGIFGIRWIRRIVGRRTRVLNRGCSGFGAAMLSSSGDEGNTRMAGPDARRSGSQAAGLDSRTRAGRSGGLKPSHGLFAHRMNCLARAILIPSAGRAGPESPLLNDGGPADGGSGRCSGIPACGRQAQGKSRPAAGRNPARENAPDFEIPVFRATSRRIGVPDCSGQGRYSTCPKSVII